MDLSTRLLKRSRAQEANVGTQEAADGAQEKINFRDVVALRTVIEAIKPFLSLIAMKRLGITAKDKDIWLLWKEARLLFLWRRLRVKFFPFAEFVLEAKGTLRRLSFHCSACQMWLEDPRRFYCHLQTPDHEYNARREQEQLGRADIQRRLRDLLPQRQGPGVLRHVLRVRRAATRHPQS